MRYPDERAEVVHAGMEMERLGLTAGTSGNVSRRVDEGMLISPSSVPYSEIRPHNVILMSGDGEALEGDGAPSVEHKVHLACYEARPDAGAVVHAHPVFATAFAAARIPLPSFLDEFGVYVGAEVRVAGYAISGSDEVASNVAEALGDDSNAAFIASHGLVAIGKTLAAALRVSHIVERAAQTYLAAQALGGPVELPDDAKELYRNVFSYLRTQ